MKFLIIILSCFLTVSAAAQNQLLQAKDLKSFYGTWSGKLEYTDYKDDKSVITLPTKLIIQGAGDSVILQFSYTEPNGKVVVGKEIWKILDNGEILQDDKDRADVTEVRRTDNSLTLTLNRLGKDNNKPSMIRKIIAVSGDALIITKRVKYEGNGNYFTRNIYTFSRN